MSEQVIIAGRHGRTLWVEDAGEGVSLHTEGNGSSAEIILGADAAAELRRALQEVKERIKEQDLQEVERCASEEEDEWTGYTARCRKPSGHPGGHFFVFPTAYYGGQGVPSDRGPAGLEPEGVLAPPPVPADARPARVLGPRQESTSTPTAPGSLSGASKRREEGS